LHARAPRSTGPATRWRGTVRRQPPVKARRGPVRRARMSVRRMGLPRLPGPAAEGANDGGAEASYACCGYPPFPAPATVTSGDTVLHDVVALYRSGRWDPNLPAADVIGRVPAPPLPALATRQNHQHALPTRVPGRGDPSHPTNLFTVERRAEKHLELVRHLPLHPLGDMTVDIHGRGDDAVAHLLLHHLHVHV